MLTKLEAISNDPGEAWVLHKTAEGELILERRGEVQVYAFKEAFHKLAEAPSIGDTVQSLVDPALGEGFLVGLKQVGSELLGLVSMPGKGVVNIPLAQLKTTLPVPSLF